MKIIVYITYTCLIVNTLLVLLYGVGYCVYEVDLFFVVWMSSILAVFAFPIGIGLSIFALIQQKNSYFRKVTLIWNIVIIGLLGLMFYILPSGSQRVVNGMEKEYLSHYEDIKRLCRYATDSLVLPDSAALIVTRNGELKARKVIERSFYIPTLIITEDTSFVIDEYQARHLLRLHKVSKMGEMSINKLDSMVTFHFVFRGFGAYWYEIPRHLYTENEMLFQLNNAHYCPYSPEVSFLFDGGAIGHEISFPMKDQFLQSHGIDSLYIYHLFH